MKLRIWLARLLLRGGEYDLTRTVDLEAAEDRLVALHRLSYVSGHLSRAYHAGRELRLGAQAALDSLYAARGKNGAHFNDTYAAPLTRALYGGEVSTEDVHDLRGVA